MEKKNLFKWGHYHIAINLRFYTTHKAKIRYPFCRIIGKDGVFLLYDSFNS